MFINLTNLLATGASSGNGWKAWLKYALQNAKDYQLSKAALVYQKGTVAACSPDLNLKSADIKALRACFADQNTETIRFQESTYVVKSVSSSQLVAFTGHHYLIVSRSAKMFVIAMCESRQLYTLAAGWINKIAGKLVEKNF